VPGARIPRIAPNGFAEPGFCQLGFSPGCRAQTSGSRAGRIARRQLRGRIVLRERCFILMGELESVTELECWLRALGSELARKCLGVAFSSPEITDRSRKSHCKPALDERVRLALEVPFDQRERFTGLSCIREQHRFPGALAGLGRTSRQAQQQREQPAGGPAIALSSDFPRA
jgi:hypothetical protein